MPTQHTQFISFNHKRKLTFILIEALMITSFCRIADASESVDSTAQNAAIDKAKLDADDAMKLPEMTVSARRGNEQAKDVPFSISVISGEDIEARRLPNLEYILRATPGVSVNSYGDPNSANVLIRGIGSLNQVSMDDGSVGLNIDGVSMSTRSMSLGTLDIERVEVLKGSQGTLFGGNSLAGAINVTTRKPTRVMEASIRGEYGQYNQHLEEAVMSGPLSDEWSGRFAIRNTGSDHWVDNTQTGNPLSKPKDLAFRGSLLWDINAGTSALFTVARQEIQRMPNLVVLRPYGNQPNADFTPGLFNNDEKTMSRYSAEINHDLADSRITSITAYTKTEYRATSGYDSKVMLAAYGVAMQNIYQSFSDQHVVSQDLRWSSLPNAPVFWVAGVNLLDSERSFDSLYPSGVWQDRNYNNHSYAAYGEVTYPLTDAFKVTGGMRYSLDKKSYDADYSAGVGVVSDKRRLKDDYTTGRVALSYALSPSTNIYSAISSGYQSGGFGDFTTQIADSVPYKPAKSNMAEIGFKMVSTDHLLSLNGAVFFTKVQDAHLLGFNFINFATNTINADTESKGVELEGAWRFASGFELSGGFSYIDAKITSDATGVYGGDVAAGSRSPDVPYWNSNIALSYRKTLSAMMGVSSPVLNTRLSYQFVGDRAADPQNHYDLDSYQKVDVRAGLMLGKAEVYMYGDNLLDKQYDLYGYYLTPAATLGAPARGRSVGVGFNYYF